MLSSSHILSSRGSKPVQQLRQFPGQGLGPGQNLGAQVRIPQRIVAKQKGCKPVRDCAVFLCHVQIGRPHDAFGQRTCSVIREGVVLLPGIKPEIHDVDPGGTVDEIAPSGGLKGSDEAVGGIALGGGLTDIVGGGGTGAQVPGGDILGTGGGGLNLFHHRQMIADAVLIQSHGRRRSQSPYHSLVHGENQAVLKVIHTESSPGVAAKARILPQKDGAPGIYPQAGIGTW